MVRSRHWIQNGQFGSSLCCFSIVALSSLCTVCDLQAGKPLAREQGAASLERCRVNLDWFQWTEMGKEACRQHSHRVPYCLHATRRSIVPVESQEPSSDGEMVNALRNHPGKLNLNLAHKT